ncbi:MAG: glycosyltransferase family 4 protein, partial [Nitrospirae bacterium]|nr:glycosyltransferase family 4 protein [Nitrospirota bacterium]
LWAGAEVQLKVLLSKLVQRPEFNLSVILLNGGRLEKEVRDLGIPVRVFPEKLWGSTRIFRELVREIKQSNVQLVHTHKYKDTILAAPAAKLCGITHVVRTVHGLREPFEGLQDFKMSLYEAIERTVHRYCVDSIIGVSSQIERKYKGEGAVSRVTCIRNGIDLEGKSAQTDRWRTRKDLGVDAGTCLIGTIGRLTPVKGIPYLLEAASILLRQGANVKVLVVGDGSIRLDLMAKTHDLGITENVVFLGHREDTDELLQALDIFVLPSLSEGIPMALLEAMAASRAVVASRVGGIPEIVEDGFEGFLVEPMDPDSLAERCRRLIASPDVARKMGEQARKRVERDFSATAMADRVASVYKELLRSR